jgi:hypothetical protein
MKQLNETFEDKEYEFIRKKKDQSGMNWHDFILSLVKIKVEQ